MSFAADIPPFFCLVRAEYLYDLKSHHGEFIPVQVFAVDSVEGRAIGFDVLTDFGGMFARLPISALCWNEKAPVHPLHELQLWDNFSYSVEAIEYRALKGLRCAVRLGDYKPEGDYMFTLSWFGNKLSEDSGDGGFKRAHIIKLDEGNFVAQPNNRIRWFEPSFIIKSFPEKPDFLTNSHNWKCEGSLISENSERYFYDVADRKTPVASDRTREPLTVDLKEFLGFSGG